MRVLRALFTVLVVISAASAAELKVKVVDPQSAAVAGADVSLSRAGESSVIATQTTSAEGVCTFRQPSAGSYQIKVLAPGFAPETLAVSSKQTELTVSLHLAPASETVVVSATRTPVASESSGADVAILNNAQLAVMQPIAANDGVRFLPGVIVNTAGQRGGLSSIFVRGGESRYNKVIVDGVTVNEPGGTFDAGTLPLAQADRLEMVRGAQSTLYGSDAMTSLVQVWTRTGSTRSPELRFGADGGNFSTAHGYASLAGARGRFDYNFFGDQFNTNGLGINNHFVDTLSAGNAGVALSETASLRVRVRHSNSHVGIPGEWNFNGAPREPPDPTDSSHLNTILGSMELAFVEPSGWQHRLTGFDYRYRYDELNPNGDSNRIFDFPSHEVDHINRAGFEYQGDYSERTWAHTTFGYRFENENGFVGDVNFGQTHGQRLNNDLYAQQQIAVGRLSVIAGARFVHDGAFGNTGVPRVAVTYEALRGNETFSGTRLRFSYATGFKEPRLEETFAGPPFSHPNTALKPERVRAFEAGIQQNFFNSRYVLNATYFNNLFHDQINYVTVDPVNFIGEYFNVNKAIAHGAEVELQAQLRTRWLMDAAYTYLSTQILEDPAPFPPTVQGAPLLRRPKHSATLLLNYLGVRWGGNLGTSFVGRRPDSDFLGLRPPVDHAAGYVRVDLGGWYAVHRRVTAYFNIENALDRRYNEVVGYPALPINFRAGLRFRIGGE
jgi:vitamin B12 transporter